MRDFELVCNRTDRIACYKYGNHLPWATNLQSLFTVNLAGQSYLNRQIVFVSASITPDSATPGLYRVQYTLQQAADYRLFIQFNGQDIPGNPFKVQKHSAPCSVSMLLASHRHCDRNLRVVSPFARG